MTADELRSAVTRAIIDTRFGEEVNQKSPDYRIVADAAIRVVIEAAADISESYEPRCDTCPRGVASAIRALLPEEQK